MATISVTHDTDQLLIKPAAFDVSLNQRLYGIGASYHKRSGGFVVAPGALLRLLETLQDHHLDLDPGTQQLLRTLQQADPDTLPVPADRKPYSYQIQGARYLLANPQALLLDEQGLGKTLQVILVTEHRMRAFSDPSRPFRCLVLCPVSLLYTWQAEIQGSFPDRRIQIWKKGKPIEPDTEWLLMSWDSLRTNIVPVVEWGPDQVVGDEIHRIKSKTSKTAKAINYLTPTYSIGLTGTLLPNKVEDVWFPVSYFRPGSLPSWTGFTARYTLQGNKWSRYAITGYKNLPELSKVIQDHSLRRLRADVLELPERIFQILSVPMTPAQRRLYQQYRDNLLEEVNADGYVVGINTLTRLLRLNQIAQSPHLANPEYPVITTKYDMLLDRLEDADGPVIVWSSYRWVLEYLQDRLGKDAGLIYGGVSAVERDRIVKAFQAGNLKVFLGHPQACREGITLTASKQVEWLDRDFNLVNRLQARDRNYRIGQRNQITLTDYVVKGTVDEMTLIALNDKEHTQQRLIKASGDETVSLTLDMIRRFLTGHH